MSSNGFDYDLFVIGGGSGGLAAAKRAASYGAKVALAEDSRIGGTCVIRGCIPKKLMYYAAHLGEMRELAGDYGWPFSGNGDSFDWNGLVRMRDTVVGNLETAHEGHLGRAGVTLYKERAHLKDEHTLELAGGRTVRSKHVLVATGSHPVLPKVEGLESTLTSDGFFEIHDRPRSAVLVGGGYIAVEFAGILQALGCHVTMLVRSQLLRGFDREIADHLADAMRRQGIHLHLGAAPDWVEKGEDGYLVQFRDGSGSQRIKVDSCVVFAIGRMPNTTGLGLEQLGVNLGGKAEILVDDNHRTNVPSIYAVGDVTDRVNLTPVAIKAGRTFADRVFGGKSATMSYENVPTAVFSQPSIGTVGLTEEEAREKFGEEGIAIYRESFGGMLYSPAPEERKVRTFMKMIVHNDSDRVVGLHMLGPDAPEIIQGFAVAVKAGATKAHFDQTIAIHPSSAEEFVLMR